jgi:signal transduction histidine kinase
VARDHVQGERLSLAGERISRELHDRVAHHMGVAHQSLELFSALRESAPERAAERFVLARETTRVALDQTRNLAAELKRLQDGKLEGGLGNSLPSAKTDPLRLPS